MNGFEGSIVSGLDASTGLGQCLALAGPVTVGCSSNSSFDNFRASEFMLHHAVKHKWLHLSDSLLEAIIPIRIRYKAFPFGPRCRAFLKDVQLMPVYGTHCRSFFQSTCRLSDMM